MIESEIEKRFVRMVRNELGGKAYKFVSPGNSGVPDRLVTLPGGVIWFVELKTDKGRLSPSQERQLKFLSGLGMKTFVLRGEAGIEAFRKEVMADEVRTPPISGDCVQLDHGT